MVNLPEISFSWEILIYSNITMASLIKNTHAFIELFPHDLNKDTQPVVGRFPTKVKIIITISNSVSCLGEKNYPDSNM
jgi:hypothetical protein